jgi:autotransporter-associated beta strand protein
MISAFPRSIAVHDISKKSLWRICGALTIALALPALAQAQTSQTWNRGLSNEWSSIAPNWDKRATWTNGNNATFGGTPQVVEIAGTVTVNSISLDGNGWTIQDSNNDGALTLTGEGRITTQGGNITINESIAGGNLVKAGVANLILGGANTYLGSTTVEAGTLQITNRAALTLSSGVSVNTGATVGLVSVTVAGVPITINGGGSGDNFGALKASGSGKSVWTGNITIGSLGSRLGATQPKGVLEVTGVIDSGGAGYGLNIRAHNDEGTVVLSNPNNTYLGPTIVIGGVLKAGVNNALPATTVVNLGNSQGQGTATFDLNGFDQRVAGVTVVPNNDVPAVVTNYSTTTAVLTVANTTTVNGTAVVEGNLSLVKEGSGTSALTCSNTYTGTTTVNEGTLELSGLLGSIETTEYFLNGGTFSVNNSSAATNKNSRINDSSTFTFRGGAFAFTGSADSGVNSTEAIGSLVLDRGFQTVRLSFGGTNVSTLVASNITRNAGGGVVFLTGANLGVNSSSMSSTSRFFTMSTPRLVGGTVALDRGINPGAKNTWIVSYFVGSASEISGGAGAQAVAPNTFVTYNAQTGFRPLNPIDEFTQNAMVSGNNIRVTQSLSVETKTAINSLVFTAPTNAIINITNGQVLTVTSGAILFASQANTITGGTLNFDYREAIIYANGSGNSTINSTITGSGGLTVAGTGVYVAAGGGSTYTGDTTLLSGTTVFSSSSSGSPGAVTKGPLGRRNLIFAGGGIRTSQAIGTRTLGNNILFKADTDLATGGSHSAFTGSVTLLEGDRVLTNSSSSNTTFEGVIGDDGQTRGITINGSGVGAVIFSNTNTYTGVTNVNGSTLLVNGVHSTGRSYHVGSGGTLGGGGDISVAGGGSVTIGAWGTLSVGNGTGNAAALTFSTVSKGALVFTDNTSTLKLDIVSDASAGTGSNQTADNTRADRLLVSGNSSLNGAHLVVGTIGMLDSATFSAGDRWKVIDWVTAVPNGTFTINPETDLPRLKAGLRWDLSDLYSGGTIQVVAVR